MKDLIAKEIMNPNVITVEDEMTVHELASFFAENLISGAPVVDKSGKLVGVVSLMDIVRSDACRAHIVQTKIESDYYSDGWDYNLEEEEVRQFHVEVDDGLSVREIMTPLIYKVTEETPIVEMADTMIHGRIHRLLVTRDDRVVGIVTTLDMLQVIRNYGE